MSSTVYVCERKMKVSEIRLCLIGMGFTITEERDQAKDDFWGTPICEPDEGWRVTIYKEGMKHPWSKCFVDRRDAYNKLFDIVLDEIAWKNKEEYNPESYSFSSPCSLEDLKRYEKARGLDEIYDK